MGGGGGEDVEDDEGVGEGAEGDLPAVDCFDAIVGRLVGHATSL